MKNCIVNANIISKDGILANHAVIINRDRIERIIPMHELSDFAPEISDMKIHEGSDTYVTAGFIDIHSDNIETLVQPRPTSVMDFDTALMEHEKMLVNQGITTMYHSLSFLRENGAAIREKEARKPDKMRELIELIHSMPERNHLIRHRFHCRFDIKNSDGYDTLMDFLDKDYIHLLSFNDHTPGQGQYRNFVKYQDNLRNYKPDLDDRQIDKIIAEKMEFPQISCEMIKMAAAAAREKGIPIASHDDDSEEKLAYVYNELKADISEFPVELCVARKAKERGMLTVAGAPNVLLGSSHSGNMSAAEAIKEGVIDILCSDYYPPAMLHAVFKLNNDYELPLWDCVNMITLNPARALGIDRDYGSIAEGKKADIVMIKILDGKPAVTKVFIDGIMVAELNYRRAKYA
jgi:alpha-D-ribose 1-methylphosphonate 5-triphosphate diphosphatase